MACMIHRTDFGHGGVLTAPVADGLAAKLKRVVRRLTDAFAAPRRSEVDRRIARLLAHSGGHFTDSMEREIMRKVLESDWSLPQ
jgi:hypothetical protein